MTGTRPNVRRAARLTTASLMAAALTALPASAQQQVQNGGALDANQQVGSGGYNSPIDQPDYRSRNLLITGQVGGGRSFRGDIGYTAPGVFQGSLGSDSLFNFQRDSVYSVAGARGISAQSYGDRVIVTRPTTSVPGYLVAGGNALSTGSSYDPSSGTLSFRQSGGGLISISGLSDVSQLEGFGSSIGYVSTPQGVVNIQASPLTGVRYNPLDANTGESQWDLNNIRKRTPNTTDLLDDQDYSPDLLEQGTDQLEQGTDLLESEEPGIGEIEDPLTISLGTQVQSAMMLQLAGRDDNNIPNAQAQTIRSHVFGKAEALIAREKAQPTEAPKAPQNPYDQLINDILAQATGEETEQDPLAQDPDQDQEPKEDNRPRWQQILEEPEKEILDARREAREVALRMSLGMVDEDGNVDYSKKLPTIDPDSELGKLLDDLDYKLPRLTTLVAQDENRISKLMARGESDLQDGKYTNAEAIYRQVVRETSGDPLAKAGLIHSQMGAGMIRSAAFNLRGLFSDHPELIALRYESNLLPKTERLQWLQGRLQKQIADENPGSEPGLILAYLGYQLDAQPLVEFGLDVAEAQAPRDPLMPILRKIWLEGEDAEAEAEAAPAEDVAK